MDNNPDYKLGFASLKTITSLVLQTHFPPYNKSNLTKFKEKPAGVREVSLLLCLKNYLN